MKFFGNLGENVDKISKISVKIFKSVKRLRRFVRKVWENFETT